MLEMIEGYFGLEPRVVEVMKPNLSIQMNNVEKIDTIVNSSSASIKKAKETLSGHVGFIMFFISGWCRQSAHAKSQVEFLRLARDHIDKRLDVMSLLQLMDKFERLVEKTLSEEDKLELGRSHSVNKL